MKRKNTLAGSLKKKGKELDLDAMKKQVEELHAKKVEPAPKPIPKTVIEPKAKPAPKPKAAKKKAPKKQRNVRLSVDAPENVYIELKMKVLRDRTNIKEYVLKLIKKDLKID